MPSLPVFSLIGRVGRGAAFFIGEGPALVTGSGELYLAYNDDLYNDNYGGYRVTLYPLPAGLRACTDGAWPSDELFGNPGEYVRFLATKGGSMSG